MMLPPPSFPFSSSCFFSFLLAWSRFPGGEEEGDYISFGAREGLGEIHQSFLDFFSVFLHEFRVFLRNL